MWASICGDVAHPDQRVSGLMHLNFDCVRNYFRSFVCDRNCEIEISFGQFDQSCHVLRRLFCAFYSPNRVNFAQGEAKVPVLSHDIFLHSVRHFKVFVSDRSFENRDFFGEFNQNFSLILRFFPHIWPQTTWFCTGLWTRFSFISYFLSPM